MPKTDIWMPIYIGDYLKDTRFLSTVEHGAYFLILMELWNNEGKLSKKNLHRIALMGKNEFSEVWDNISVFFDDDGDSISQKRLSKEYENSQKRRNSASENGKKGGRPKTDGLPAGKPIDNPKGNPQKTSSSSPSPTKEREEKEIHILSEKSEYKPIEGKAKNNEPWWGDPEEEARKKFEAEALEKKKARTTKMEMSAKGKFEEARRIYPGTKRGLEPEWMNFKKKNKDWAAITHLLAPKIQEWIHYRQLANHYQSKGMSVFWPEPKNFQTWINQQCWTEELVEPQPQQRRQDGRQKTFTELEGERIAEQTRRAEQGYYSSDPSGNTLLSLPEMGNFGEEEDTGRGNPRLGEDESSDIEGNTLL